jgi:homoserine dehydrogenase
MKLAFPDDDTLSGAALTGLPAAPQRPLRVALAGYGHVGQALAARLAGDPAYKIVAVLVRDTARPRAFAPPVPLTASVDHFLYPEADVLVDVLSCHKTGAALASRCLAMGVHAVSASKRAVSTRYEALTGAARAGAAKLSYGAAVGGAAPVLETVAAASSVSPVVEVAGILNGTVNYLLDRLAQGCPFEAALVDARLAGFAEEDPSEDLTGADAAAKLHLIAIEAFGADAAAGLKVETETLDAAKAAVIAASGERWVQLARLRRTEDGLEASVKLERAANVPALPALPDEWNGAAVSTEDGRVFRCLGRGAGGAPTSEAIVADLVRVRAAIAAGGA